MSATAGVTLSASTVERIREIIEHGDAAVRDLHDELARPTALYNDAVARRFANREVDALRDLQGVIRCALDLPMRPHRDPDYVNLSPREVRVA